MSDTTPPEADDQLAQLSLRDDATAVTTADTVPDAVHDTVPVTPLPSKLAAAEAEKRRGNSLFAAGDYPGAKAAYDLAFVNIFTSKEEWEHHLTAADKAALNAFKVPLHLNRCIARLRMGELDLAHWDAAE
eukprot:CAMPEP_0198331942 /NCGR_PEP_ID=MMETSP1450-20131203/17938_1 /TAXON_ID=753684 ORGANISM="Madagascaria erythrocladiodes, Strain CCMP3234" /NCGR_SAMPLE_ID=MMETSP1450 /ASSEMBLY_ACC=CAM_ASM_001115 /LENGTH=130 /DNA_ID=CAMNT_0044036361 /DNA_START=10 /DNA_END=399 /DNA_ORIENTATION=-